MSSKQHIPPTVFDSIDDLTRDAILHLNKKLIELKKEITIKLELLGEDGDEKSKPQKKQLLVLDGEIERALRSIDKVVNMVVSEDLSSSERCRPRKVEDRGL